MDMSMDPAAVVKALRSFVALGEIRSKLNQLAGGEAPSILAIRAYGLTERFEDLVTTPHAMDLRGFLGDDTWARLPARCKGIFLAFLGDIIDPGRRRPPVMFIPAPNRPLTAELWQYFQSIDVLTNDVLRSRDLIVA
jgi:hypothetical protein